MGHRIWDKSKNFYWMGYRIWDKRKVKTFIEWATEYEIKVNF